MKDFIEKTLHQPVEIKPYKEIKRFPLIIQVNYDFYQMEIMKQICILVRPKDNIGLATLRRQQKQIERLTGIYCVLYLKKMNYYSRDKMLEEGISFIFGSLSNDGSIFAVNVLGVIIFISGIGTHAE